MIQLYGLRLSNYYSLTKALLIEKGLEFEEVTEAVGQHGRAASMNRQPLQVLQLAAVRLEQLQRRPGQAE